MPDSNRSLITALTRQLQQAKAELRATEAVIRAYHLGVCDAVLERLKAVEPDEMTPKQALDELYELKRIVEER